LFGILFLQLRLILYIYSLYCLLLFMCYIVCRAVWSYDHDSRIISSSWIKKYNNVTYYTTKRRMLIFYQLCNK